MIFVLLKFCKLRVIALIFIPVPKLDKSTFESSILSCFCGISSLKSISPPPSLIFKLFARHIFKGILLQSALAKNLFAPLKHKFGAKFRLKMSFFVKKSFVLLKKNCVNFSFLSLNSLKKSCKKFGNSCKMTLKIKLLSVII